MVPIVGTAMCSYYVVCKDKYKFFSRGDTILICHFTSCIYSWHPSSFWNSSDEYDLILAHCSAQSFCWRKGNRFLQRRWWELKRFTRSLRPWMKKFAKLLRYAFQCHIPATPIRPAPTSQNFELSICEKMSAKLPLRVQSPLSTLSQPQSQS